MADQGAVADDIKAAKGVLQAEITKIKTAQATLKNDITTEAKTAKAALDAAMDQTKQELRREMQQAAQTATTDANALIQTMSSVLVLDPFSAFFEASLSVDGDQKAFWFFGRKWSLDLSRTDDKLGIKVYLTLAAGADILVHAIVHVKIRDKMQHAEAFKHTIGKEEDGRKFGLADGWGFKSFATLAELQAKGCYDPTQDQNIVLGVALHVHKAAHDWWTEAPTTLTDE